MDRHQPRLAYASEMDAVVANSSPASDPRSWTLGVAGSQRQRDPINNEPAVGTVDDGLLGTSLFTRYRWLKGIMALFQGAGVALLFPLFVVGLPVALIFRLVLELTGWRILSPNRNKPVTA